MYPNLDASGHNAIDVGLGSPRHCELPSRLPTSSSGPLASLTGWVNGTIVEDVAVPSGCNTLLTPYHSEAALILMVLLEDCDSLQVLPQVGAAFSGPATAGTAIPLDLHDAYTTYAPTRFRTICFGIELKLLNLLGRRIGRKPIGAVAQLFDLEEPIMADDAIRNLALIAASVLRDTSDPQRLFLEQLANAVGLHLLLRSFPSEIGSNAGIGGLAHWQMAKAKKLMTADLGRTVPTEVVARECGLSASHFARAFRQSNGTSPHAWLISQRVSRAKHLMQATSATLAEIAIECGFADQSHLTRTFTRQEGTPPGLWRRCIPRQAIPQPISTGFHRVGNSQP